MSERPGKLSADGLRIYFEVMTSATNVDLYVSTRATPSSPWEAPTRGPFAANVNGAAYDGEPFVSADELELYFATWRPPIWSTAP
jgi:hypothetical protein